MTGQNQNSKQDPTIIAKNLFTKIEEHAKKSEFTEAEALREKLIETVPGALSEIIKSNTIIEEAKTAALDKDHLAIWQDLYEDLSEEETNCLFFSLKKVVVPPKKRILAHGALNSKLFLIERGQVTVFYPKQDKNIVIAQLGRGDMLGEYTFTTISLCSASVVSNTEVQLRYLDSSSTDSWLEKQPALYDKLLKFCQEYGKVEQILQKKELEKRTNSRYNIKGIIAATVLDKEGKKTSSNFRGSLSNISIVGSCFDIHCSKKETARALLARHIHLTFEIEINGNPYRFAAIGKIVRVSFHLHSDYSVHVHFVKELDQGTFKQIIPKS